MNIKKETTHNYLKKVWKCDIIPGRRLDIFATFCFCDNCEIEYKTSFVMIDLIKLALWICRNSKKLLNGVNS